MIPFPKSYSDPVKISQNPNFLTSQEIDVILNEIEDIPKTDALILNDNQINESNFIKRTSQVKWIFPDVKWEWLFAKTLNEINVHNSMYWGFNIEASQEPFQYTEYNFQDKGHYNWHLDIGPLDITSQRKVSVTIQLSSPEEYEGGDLEFITSHEIQTAEKIKGSICLFPSYLCHRVTPVTKGIRKSLVLWVGGCTFK